MQLRLGYPAASVIVQLALYEQGRIGAETLTDPTHLVNRQMRYSHGD